MDHSTAILALQCHGDHERAALERRSCTNVGQVLEALVYYDRVYLLCNPSRALADFFEFFARTDDSRRVCGLFEQRKLVPLYSPLMVGSAGITEDPARVDGLCQFRLSHDASRREIDPSFKSRILRQPQFRGAFRSQRDWRRACDVLGDVVQTLPKGVEEPMLRAAEQLCDHEESVRPLLQACMELRYRRLGVREGPLVRRVSIERALRPDGGKCTWLRWDLDEHPGLELAQDGEEILTAPMVLAQAGDCTELLTGARAVGADLIPRGAEAAALDPVFAALGHAGNTAFSVVNELEVRVDFPSLESLVNRRTLSLRDIESVHQKAKMFREWLQSAADRDGDAIVAYHNELSRTMGLSKFGGRLLSLGVSIGGSATGFAIGGLYGAVAGTLAAEVPKFYIDTLTACADGWRPQVFGDWLRHRVAQRLAKYI